MFKKLKDKLKEAKDKLTGKVEEKEKEVQEESQEKKTEEKAKAKKETKKKTAKKKTKPKKTEKKIEEKLEEEEKVETPEKEIVDKTQEKKTGLLAKITHTELEESDVDPILQELEMGLIECDVAFDVSAGLTQYLKEQLLGHQVKKKNIDTFIEDKMEEYLLSIFEEANDIDLIETIENCKKEGKPCLVELLGFNGSGKTTTAARLGKMLKDKGYNVVFAAGDTFRAAAVEQLSIHGENLGIKVIKNEYGSDAAAIVYDAVEHAKAKNVDVILADTAGRSHANTNLMDELKKISRVNNPDLKILVIDSLTGNDALDQAESFHEAVGVDAVILTKMDVNEKGGAALSVVHSIKTPILYIGTGQDYEDLESFNREKFVKGLFE